MATMTDTQLIQEHHRRNIIQQEKDENYALYPLLLRKSSTKVISQFPRWTPSPCGSHLKKKCVPKYNPTQIAPRLNYFTSERNKIQCNNVHQLKNNVKWNSKKYNTKKDNNDDYCFDVQVNLTEFMNTQDMVNMSNMGDAELTNLDLTYHLLFDDDGRIVYNYAESMQSCSYISPNSKYDTNNLHDIDVGEKSIFLGMPPSLSDDCSKKGSVEDSPDGITNLNLSKKNGWSPERILKSKPPDKFSKKYSCTSPSRLESMSSDMVWRCKVKTCDKCISNGTWNALDWLRKDLMNSKWNRQSLRNIWNIGEEPEDCPILLDVNDRPVPTLRNIQLWEESNKDWEQLLFELISLQNTLVELSNITKPVSSTTFRDSITMAPVDGISWQNHGSSKDESHLEDNCLITMPHLPSLCFAT